MATFRQLFEKVATFRQLFEKVATFRQLFEKVATFRQLLSTFIGNFWTNYRQLVPNPRRRCYEYLFACIKRNKMDSELLTCLFKIY